MTNESEIDVGRSGYELLSDPILNKGTAFTEDERDAFDLHGLLPPHVSDLDTQVERRLAVLRDFERDIEKYAFLRGLQDDNETLFYALLTRNLPELMPIVYTPTVGEGCQSFSRLWRKPRGVFVSPPHLDRLDQILGHRRFDDVRVIVVSDGERILGLGDQGAGGMGIPIGKLSLYTGCGGIDPRWTLPILLDTGTDNAERRADPLYIGWRHERVRGADYDRFVEAFVTAVARRWPHVMLQWEDFAGSNAGRLLERYRDRLCTFNDDIQGTAAIATAMILSALQVSGGTMAEQRVVVLGAGSAGCGISALLARAMVAEGLDEAHARRQFWLVDRDGLLVEGMDLQSYQAPFARGRDEVAGWDGTGLAAVIGQVKPTVLLGLSGQAGAFDEASVRAMAAGTERPLIFPLSNPTSRAEATPADIMDWTGGRAIVGTGSPFAPVPVGGRMVTIDQVNNSYIFPGMGLAVVAGRIARVTDEMFLAAARALAAMSPARENPDAPLLPPLERMREVSARIASAVLQTARSQGHAETGGDPDAVVRAAMWEPVYRPYRRRHG